MGQVVRPLACNVIQASETLTVRLLESDCMVGEVSVGEGSDESGVETAESVFEVLELWM